jgi:peptide methionine sulfoxide reductase MsrB
MTINRMWAMPSKDTFTIKPIQEILEKYNVGIGWVDPFAGDYSPAEVTNDLNPLKPTKYHLNAVDFASIIEGPFKGCVFDPPYSPRQMKECYNSIGLSFTKENGQEAPHFAKVKDILKDKITDYVINFGWNSSGFGKSRGFEIVEILMVNHGGNGHPDTIVTIEQNTKPMIHSFTLRPSDGKQL